MQFYDSRRLRVLKAPLLNGAGTQNAGNANYTSANSSIAQFVHTSDGQVLIPLGLQIIIEDTNTDYNKFGNQTELTTGLAVRLQTVGGTNQKDLLFGAKIKSNISAYRLGADITPLNDSAAATRAVNIWLPLFSKHRINHNEQIAVVHAENITVSGLYYWLHYELVGGAGS